MADVEELRQMVKSFRNSELITLLTFAQASRSGRKQDLLARALDLTKSRMSHVHMKIREIYQSIQAQTVGAVRPAITSNALPSSLSTGQRYPGSGVPPSLHPPPSSSSCQRRSQHPPQQSVTQSHHPETVCNGARCVTSATQCDIVLAPIPFYDLLHELVKPTHLPFNRVQNRYLGEFNMKFSLTVPQASDIALSRFFSSTSKLDYSVQIHMRFCSVPINSSKVESDSYPLSLVVKINNRICPLPNVTVNNKQTGEGRRQPRPVDVTNLCNIAPMVQNSVYVQWSPDANNSGAQYVTFHIVRHLSTQDLVSRLLDRATKDADFTRSIVKQKLNMDIEEDDISSMTSMKCSLQCPLGKCRMRVPCRSVKCTHLQCFDASSYVQMNERKSGWHCPVCGKLALYTDLFVDGYFFEILQQTSHDCLDVILNSDCSWKEVKPTTKESSNFLKNSKSNSEITIIENIDSDDSNQGDTEELKSPKSVCIDTSIAEVTNSTTTTTLAEVIDSTLNTPPSSCTPTLDHSPVDTTQLTLEDTNCADTATLLTNDRVVCPLACPHSSPPTSCQSSHTLVPSRHVPVPSTQTTVSGVSQQKSVTPAVVTRDPECIDLTSDIEDDAESISSSAKVSHSAATTTAVSAQFTVDSSADPIGCLSSAELDSLLELDLSSHQHQPAPLQHQPAPLQHQPAPLQHQPAPLQHQHDVRQYVSATQVPQSQPSLYYAINHHQYQQQQHHQQQYSGLHAPAMVPAHHHGLGTAGMMSMQQMQHMSQEPAHAVYKWSNVAHGVNSMSASSPVQLERSMSTGYPVGHVHPSQMYPAQSNPYISSIQNMMCSQTNDPMLSNLISLNCDKMLPNITAPGGNFWHDPGVDLNIPGANSQTPIPSPPSHLLPSANQTLNQTSSSSTRTSSRRSAARAKAVSPLVISID